MSPDKNQSYRPNHVTLRCLLWNLWLPFLPLQGTSSPLSSVSRRKTSDRLHIAEVLLRIASIPELHRVIAEIQTENLKHIDSILMPRSSKLHEHSDSFISLGHCSGTKHSRCGMLHEALPQPGCTGIPCRSCNSARLSKFEVLNLGGVKLSSWTTD